MTNPITEFRGDFRFLSNFWPSVVGYLGVPYPTVEHAYQAAKCLHSDDRDMIRVAQNPGAARRLGQKVPLRGGWEDQKLGIMEELLRSKFTIPTLRALLLSTHPRELIEGNPWHDTFWGVCGGVGQNHLGKLLMKIRDEIVSTTQEGL